MFSGFRAGGQHGGAVVGACPGSWAHEPARSGAGHCGFLPRSERHASQVEWSLQITREREWLFVPVRQPCDERATCPPSAGIGSIPPATL